MDGGKGGGGGVGLRESELHHNSLDATYAHDVVDNMLCEL